MTDTPRPAHQYQPRPQLLAAGAFARLAQTAWGVDPTRSLAKQMHLATGVSENTCQRWLNDEIAPPADRVLEAYGLALAATAERDDLIDTIPDIAAIAALVQKTPKSEAELRQMIDAKLDLNSLARDVTYALKPMAENGRGENFDVVLTGPAKACADVWRWIIAPILGQYSLAE